jgi:hypothetical protein
LVAGSNPARGAKLDQALSAKTLREQNNENIDLAAHLAAICKIRGSHRMAKKKKHTATSPRISAKRARDKRQKPPASTMRIPPTTVPEAGTASKDIGLTLTPEPAGLEVKTSPPVVALSAVPLRVGASPQISFRNNAERAEGLARALAATIKREIERLNNERHNDPARQAEIEFLEVVSSTLDEIAAAIGQARRAATPDDREQKFVKAETLASSLANAGRDFAQRNYERVVDYGGYCVLAILGTQFFTTLFGVPPEEALLTQVALLGFSGIKK